MRSYIERAKKANPTIRASRDEDTELLIREVDTNAVNTMRVASPTASCTKKSAWNFITWPENRSFKEPVFRVTTPHQIRVLMAPVRMEIVEALMALGSSPVRRLADYLSRAPESLYYHLRRNWGQSPIL